MLQFHIGIKLRNLVYSILLPKNLKIKIYKTINLRIIFVVVSYERETWFLTLKEKEIGCWFVNGELRKSLKPNREYLTGNWRKLYNEELYDLVSSLDIGYIKCRRMRWRFV
jgi:hypothetical protein